MKTMKRIAALTLALILCAGCFAACGNGNKPQGSGDAKKDIEIAYWNAGLGDQWLKDVIAAFNAKHPEYYVYYTASASAATINSTLELSGNTVDLYFTSERADASDFIPLDDMLNATAPGDSKPLIEKFNMNYLKNAQAADGHYYQLTYGGGVVGIVYNKTLFQQAGITELPRTTNELAIVCDKLYSAGISPICHFAPEGYYGYLSDALIYQYDREGYTETFYSCTDANGVSPSKEVFTTKDGRYEVLKAYEKILTYDYVMEGSNSIDHVTAQTMFLNNSAAMMVNGSWIANEMASVEGSMENFAMMRTPVLSAITDKLTTVKSDAQLRKVITAIDEVHDGVKQLSDYQSNEGYSVDGVEVSKEDWDYIYTARFTVASNFSGENACIPSYSENIEGAKAFLSFLYSDEGYRVYAKALKNPMPMTLSDGSQLDMSDWNAFQTSQVALLEEAVAMPCYYVASRHNIFRVGGATKFADVPYVSRLCASNKADRKTADAIWDEIIAKVNDEYENKWLANIK